MDSSKNIKFITKDTVTRLLRDVRTIIKNPLTSNGIYYTHDDEDMMKGYAMIVGSSETPYYGGFYVFEFFYPTDYPHSPPIVKYWTNGDNIRFNPNLYTSGKVCISLLNTWRGEQWTSCQSISTVLLNLCTLLCKDPLLNEPGVNENHIDLKNYNEIIDYKNIEIAILRMVLKDSRSFPSQFDIFSPYIRENFIKNKDEIISFLEEKNKKHKSQFKLSTSMYGISVTLDYKNLLQKYSDAAKQITL